jgi:hypothetical protein
MLPLIVRSEKIAWNKQSSFYFSILGETNLSEVSLPKSHKKALVDGYGQLTFWVLFRLYDFLDVDYFSKYPVLPRLRRRQAL